jgi:hypothetical protein
MTTQIKLTPQQLATLNSVEHDLSSKLTDLDKAEECGIGCSQLKEMVQGMIAECQTLRKNFGQ